MFSLKEKGDEYMTDNELLLALSEMMDKKLEPVKADIRDIKITMENDLLPRLQNIENCYTSTYKRYQSGINQLESMQADIDITKKVLSEHSQKLQKIS
jgi:hypothetical protein